MRRVDWDRIAGWLILWIIGAAIIWAVITIALNLKEAWTP